MSKKIISSVMLLVIILFGFTSCIGQTGDDASQDIQMLNDLLNRVMTYIGQHHRDADPWIPDNISWSQVSRTKKPGYTRYVYGGNGWTVTIGLAATAEQLYEVSAEHQTAGITWTGTARDGTIAETEYTKK